MSKEQERLGKYELLERLGQGGMGEVWKARDTQLRRYVAIKFLHANLQDNPDFVMLFTREAQFIASLHHPNIVQIHDFQLTNTRGSSIAAYMVMDYIEGGTLADYIRNTSRKGLFPPAADIVFLFSAISLALDYAHQKGMIHRDIKPANILLDRHTTTGKSMGEPILTDFGIAKWQGGGASTLTRAGIGTPLYISPEQAKGLPAGERSDLYSLGIILYEILTGITPFRGTNQIAIMMQHLQELPTPPSLINPNISPELSAIVLQSIAKDPEARFPTASAMTVALARALKVPVPSSLNKPETTKEQSAYNPLQPSRLWPDMSPSPPALTASPPAAPSSTGYPGAQINTPSHLTPATSDHGEGDPHAGTAAPRSTSGPGFSGLNSPYGDHPLQSPPLSPSSLLPVQLRRRGLYIALIACVILLLIGIVAFSVRPLLSSQNTTPTPNPPGSVVGHIVFTSSPNTPYNTFDQLQIDLGNITSPPAGKTYFAWLENSNNEATAIPRLELQISNGGVHVIYHAVPAHSDLFAPNNRFLITEEDTGTSSIIPSPDLSTHLYYAIISHTSSSSPTFPVMQCPSSSTNNAGNPCR